MIDTTNVPDSKENRVGQAFAAALDGWVYDPVAASKDSRTHSRPKNAPPHWVRCDFVRDGVRCVKGEGHEKGYGEHAKHEGPKT